jgi:hypothetical protein
MALESAFESLMIGNRCLPFNPAENGLLTEEQSIRAFEAVPRYLFRVISPDSQGVNRQGLLKSYNAAQEIANGTVDIFAMERRAAAAMLNRHLRWHATAGGDNLISWTSSLLTAVSYIMYLRDRGQGEKDLKDIKLGVIDTTDFPSRTFLRDLELINAFRLFDPELEDFAGLRTRRHKDYARYHGYYYFGEYLCQGSLTVGNSCQFVDASALVANGLYCLRPEFKESSGQWANRTIALREVFYSAAESAITQQELSAAVCIAQLFEPRWRPPIATFMLALRPRTSSDPNILHALNPHILQWGEEEHIQSSGLAIRVFENRYIMDFVFKTRIVPHEYLPELEPVRCLLAALRVDCCVSTVLSK